MKTSMTSCVLMGVWFAMVAQAPAQDSTGKGTITVGAIEIDMKAGTLYSITVQGKDFTPQVTLSPDGFLPIGLTDFRKPGLFNSYYMPKKDGKQTIHVVPVPFGLKGKGPFEFEYDIKAISLAEKPVIYVKDELTANDPAFKVEFANRQHHKGYGIKMKAKQFYIIDMREPAKGKLDSYLYLLDPKGRVIAQDDDSGGFPSARIIFQAPEDGEYRAIATGLGDALGEFVLTVRTEAKK